MKGQRTGRATFSNRMRLALWAVATLGIVITAVVFYAYWTQNVLTLRTSELRRQVSVIAAGVAVSDIVPGSAADVDSSRARLLKVEAGIIAARLAVVSGSGEVLYTTAAAGSLRSYPLTDLEPGATSFDARTGVTDISGVGRALLVAVPVSFADTGEPDRYLLGVRSLSDMGAADAWVAISIVVAALVALVAAWGVGSLLARRVTRPLSRLTAGAREIAAGAWGRQVPIEGDDEVAELAQAFNEMSDRTAATYRAQQAFVSDVSHEIRTPVTSIGGFAGAIADGTLSDREGVARAARIIVTEAAHLSEITTSLLGLADIEAGTVELAREHVDPTRIADALLDRFEMVAREKGVRLEVDLGTTGPLGDSGRVLQAISALVDNALRHAAHAVRVSAEVARETWRVSVEDDGPGVPPEERERVFDRFARLDTARSRGGTGLGLAICRRLVELMGGSVRADASRDLGGARFIVELPAAREIDPVSST